MFTLKLDLMQAGCRLEAGCRRCLGRCRCRLRRSTPGAACRHSRHQQGYDHDPSAALAAAKGHHAVICQHSSSQAPQRGERPGNSHRREWQRQGCGLRARLRCYRAQRQRVCQPDVPLTPGPTWRSGIAIQDRQRGTKRCHRLQAAAAARSRSNPNRGGHQSRSRRPPWLRDTLPSSSSLSVKPGNSAAERARNRKRHHPNRLLMRQGHGDDLHEHWSDSSSSSLPSWSGLVKP